MNTTYQNILNQIFEERCLTNANYSMRAFARDLDVPPSTLSEVLNHKKGISPQRSINFAKRLKLPEWQTQFFCDLVAKQHAKNPSTRREAANRLKEKKQVNHLHLIQKSTMSALTSWIDLAILELTYLKDFKPLIKWIAKKLQTDEILVAKSLARLKTTNLLEVNAETGKWSDTSPLFSSTDSIPNNDIANFHKTVLQLGLRKLDNPDINSRIVKSVVFSLSEENIPRAKKVLDEAIAKIVAIADESGQDRADVMCFSSQLFSLIIKDSK